MRKVTINLIINISLGCFILLLTGSCRDLMRVKSSIRKTQTEVRVFDRTLKRVQKGIGLDNLKSKNKGESDSVEAVSSSQKTMLKNYGYLYDFLNRDNELKSNNFKWDSINNYYYVKEDNYRTIAEEYEVFGWHPYWMGSKWEKYPFELLSTISYFSYKIDHKTGGFTNPLQIEDWKNTTMVDSAKVNNTRVLLTVSLHGYQKNKEFLDSDEKWANLFNTVSKLVIDKNADGIDLNFEVLPYSKRFKFNKLVKELHDDLESKFKDINKDFFLSITLPANNSRDIFDTNFLDAYADLFVIMGYDYHVGNPEQGAVAPLRSSENKTYSLNTTLNYYTDSGINPKKTVLALPYYGNLWTGKLEKKSNGYFNLTEFDKPLTFSEIKLKYIDNEELKIKANRDEYSMTNYYNITFDDFTTQELWFDDDYTLRKKYDFALSNNLKGIGIWALGYDHGYSDLWNVIEDKFSTNKKVVVNPIVESEGYPIRLSRFLLKYQKVFIITAIFFLIAIVTAFTFLISDWRVRDSIVRKVMIRIIFVGSVFILLIPLSYVVFDFINDILKPLNAFFKYDWRFYIAYILGVFTIVIAYAVTIKPKKRP